MSASTPALALLTQRGVAHSVHEFHHDPRATDFGLEAAVELGVDPGRIFKTLVWHVDDAPAVAICPVTSTVSPKKLAAALGARRSQMAPVSVAERLSGSVVGAISPLGLRRTLPTVLDDSALEHESIYVSAGKRGLEVRIAPKDLIDLLSARVASITHETNRVDNS